MLTVLQRYQPARGRPPKLGFEAQLLLTLRYWRDYPSLFKLGLAYGVSEASAWRIVRRVEDQVIQFGGFSLPTRNGTEASVIVVDATDIRVERLKKQRRWYSGKRKQHTVKVQVFLDTHSGHIVITQLSPARLRPVQADGSHVALSPLLHRRQRL